MSNDMSIPVARADQHRLPKAELPHLSKKNSYLLSVRGYGAYCLTPINQSPLRVAVTAGRLASSGSNFEISLAGVDIEACRNQPRLAFTFRRFFDQSQISARPDAHNSRIGNRALARHIEVRVRPRTQRERRHGELSSRSKWVDSRSGDLMNSYWMDNEPRFSDRLEAGRMLARQLDGYAGRSDVIVLALPRGGVPVGYEVAQALGVELDVLVVRKLGVPHHPELAMGAIASGGALYLDEQTIRMADVTQPEIVAVLNDERRELARREALCRGQRPPLNIEGRTVIIVDDGIATGSSMRVAIDALRTGKPARIVVAVPVAPEDTAERLRGLADEFVCTHSARQFGGVGRFYRDFGQTSDAEVRALLARSHQDIL